MKICCVADLHLIYNDPLGKNIKLRDFKINSRLWDKLLALEDAVRMALQENCELFVCAGDMFDSYNPSRELKRLFFNSLVPLFDREIDVVYIMGNHEVSKSGKHVFYDFEQIPKNNFYIIDKKSTSTMDGITMAFLPHGTDLETVKNTKNADICFGHLAVIGELMNDNQESKSGIPSNELYDRFNIIRLGHFHKRSDFYIGSLVRRSFHEKNYINGFEIIDTDDMTVAHYLISDRDFVEVVIDKDNTEFEVTSTKEDILKVKVIGTKEFIESVKYSQIWEDIPCHKLLPIETEVVGSTAKKEKTASIVNIDNLIPEYAKENDEESLTDFGLDLWRKYGK